MKDLFYLFSEKSHKLDIWAIFLKWAPVKTAPKKSAGAKDPVYMVAFIGKIKV